MGFELCYGCMMRLKCVNLNMVSNNGFRALFLRVILVICVKESVYSSICMKMVGRD
jgi:hypothetical protein